MSHSIQDPSASELSVKTSEAAVPEFARLIDVMNPIRDSGTRIAEFLGETAAGMTAGHHT